LIPVVGNNEYGYQGEPNPVEKVIGYCSDGEIESDLAIIFELYASDCTATVSGSCSSWDRMLFAVSLPGHFMCSKSTRCWR
jgi:hypothetical protein